jgi:hypothetical protein
MTATSETPLARARRRDADRRRQHVHQALADMHADGSEITISAVAARARVHRSFIHRHGDLHVAVLKAAADTITGPSPAPPRSATSPRSPRTPTCTSRTAGSPGRSPTWKSGCRNYSASRHSTAAASAPQPTPPPCKPNSRQNVRPPWTCVGCWKSATTSSPPPARPTAG